MRGIWAVAAAVLSMAGGGRAAAPLAAYGGLPSIESIEISPDGSKLAVAMSTTGEDRVLAVKTLPNGGVQSFPVGAVKIRGLDWVGGDHLIITASQTSHLTYFGERRREYFMGFDLDLASRKVQPLLKGQLGTGGTGTHLRGSNDHMFASLNILAGPPEVRVVDGVPTLFLRGVTFRERYGVLTVFRMDLKNGKANIVEQGDPDTDDIALGPDGVSVARTDYDVQSGHWALKMKHDGGWRVSKEVVAKTDPPTLIGLGRSDGSVLVAEEGDAGDALHEVANDGAWGDPLDTNSDGVVYDPQSHRMIGLHSLVGDEERYRFFDAGDQKVWDAVTAAFKGDRVRLASWSADRRKVVVLVDSATEGPAYALVDVAAKSATWLGARYQKLSPEDISPVRPVRFKAKDGLALTGYLTTPYGAQAKNLPLIVFPHGGPASRDEPGFDWWAQAMASRGYAVLQVNFRGSDGFGAPFLQAGYGEWGRKMQTDLSDGVRDLAAQGVIDPKRVCIVGASYGGYAALAGAALDSGVYRCAVSVAGLSDLSRFVTWSKTQNGVGAVRYWTRFMGAEAVRDPSLAEISPAAHVDRITIPVLLIHGQDDTVVPLEQSQVMADALQKAGKPVELVVQKGADHWLSRGDTRLETLQATMDFLEKNNPPN